MEISNKCSPRDKIEGEGLHLEVSTFERTKEKRKGKNESYETLDNNSIIEKE